MGETEGECVREVEADFYKIVSRAFEPVSGERKCVRERQRVCVRARGRVNVCL